MVSWWNALTFLEQIFALMAIPATIVLIIQTIMLIIGFDDAGPEAGALPSDVSGIDGVDFDTNGAEVHDLNLHEHGADPGLSVFTFRGFVAFFAVFGWLGLAMLRSGFMPAVSITCAFAAGAAMMVLIAYMLKAMLKLQQSGNIELKNALGKSGTVYIRIPPLRKGSGKISMVVQEKLIEVDAVTDDEAPINSREEVTVIGISNQDTLVVTRKRRSQ